MKHRHNENIQSIGPLAKYNLQSYKPGTRAPAYGMGIRLNGVGRPMIVKEDNC